MGALKGAGFEVAVERGGHRGNGGVSGGHAGRAQGIVWKARVDEDRDGEEVPGQGSEEDGPGPPWDVSPFVLFLCSFDNFLLSGKLDRGRRRQSAPV